MMKEDDFELDAKDQLTQLVRELGIQSWGTLLAYIREMPYGLNSDQTQLKLVLHENRGTRSSKHALVKHLADLNGIPNVKLVMAIYRMNARNAPEVAAILRMNDLSYIPEIQVYLKINSKRIDLTRPDTAFESIRSDILIERLIKPDQIGSYKLRFHKLYMSKWLSKTQSSLSLGELWTIRERCVEALGGQT